MRELVGEGAEDAGHGRDADPGAEEDNDVVVGEFLFRWWWWLGGGGEGRKWRSKKKETGGKGK